MQGKQWIMQQFILILKCECEKERENDREGEWGESECVCVCVRVCVWLLQIICLQDYTASYYLNRSRSQKGKDVVTINFL